MKYVQYFYVKFKRKFSLLYSRENNLRKATTLTKIFAKIMQKIEILQWDFTLLQNSIKKFSFFYH